MNPKFISFRYRKAYIVTDDHHGPGGIVEEGHEKADQVGARAVQTPSSVLQY